MQENETVLLSNPIPNVNSKWIKDMIISYETIKLFEENSKKSLEYKHEQLFPWAKETKSKMNKWDCIKLKSFCTAKDTISRTKRHSTVWENIFVNDRSD